MEVISSSSGRALTLTLRGELDHHGAKDTMQRMELALDAALPKKLILDLSGVSFMDSSGIAVVMRAQKRMRALDGGAVLRGVPPQAKSIFIKGFPPLFAKCRFFKFYSALTFLKRKAQRQARQGSS